MPSPSPGEERLEEVEQNGRPLFIIPMRGQGVLLEWRGKLATAQCLPWRPGRGRLGDGEGEAFYLLWTFPTNSIAEAHTLHRNMHCTHACMQHFCTFSLPASTYNNIISQSQGVEGEGGIWRRRRPCGLVGGWLPKHLLSLPTPQWLALCAMACSQLCVWLVLA